MQKAGVSPATLSGHEWGGWRQAGRAAGLAGCWWAASGGDDGTGTARPAQVSCLTGPAV